MSKTSPWALWTLNFQLSMSVMNEVSPELRELGLEIKEFFVLGNLDEHPTPADLARTLMLPKPSITFMVKRLDAAGFLRRAAHPTPDADRRRSPLTLTPAGRTVMEQARNILDAAYGKRLARLTAAERALLGRLLGRMVEE